MSVRDVPKKMVWFVRSCELLRYDKEWLPCMLLKPINAEVKSFFLFCFSKKTPPRQLQQASDYPTLVYLKNSIALNKPTVPMCFVLQLCVAFFFFLWLCVTLGKTTARINLAWAQIGSPPESFIHYPLSCITRIFAEPPPVTPLGWLMLGQCVIPREAAPSLKTMVCLRPLPRHMN